MNIEYLLKKYKIKKIELGRALGYKSDQGIYTALNSEKQRPYLYAFLLKMLLEKKGVDIEKLLEGIEGKEKEEVKSIIDNIYSAKK